MSRITKWKLEKTKVKVVFRLQFHATNIPQTGWEKLFISFIPSESGKVTAKTTKANVKNGTCKWGDPIYETTRLLLDGKNKLFDDKLYKLVVGMGSSRSSILGEATINLADYADALKPSAVALPLHGTDTGTILHVTVQLLTSKTGFREFEQQRELRETGLPIGSNLNGDDESGTARVSSSDQKYKDQTDKVDTRIRFTKESKLLPSLEEKGESDEYGDSHVGCDGSSNTSGSLYADKLDTSSTNENDSLKSRVYGDLNRQTEKGDPSDHRILTNGSNDRVQGWNSDYSVDYDLAVDSEENNRLRGSLEAAESSIYELKLELSTLQGHAEEIGLETQKLADQLVVEIASGQELAKEVSVLKSQCSKFKDDFEQLKSKKLSPKFTNMESDKSKQDPLSQDKQMRWLNGLLIVENRVRDVQEKAHMGLHETDFSFLHSDLQALLKILQDLKNETTEVVSLPGVISAEGAQPKDHVVSLRGSQHLVPGTGFDVDLYEPESIFQYVGLPSLVPHLPESTRDTEAMAGKILELLQQLDEAKVEKETLVRKMDQMECYYEALVQELEENQKQILGEFHSLRNDHSTCHYTISAHKAEMESILHDMNVQALRFSEEKLALDSLNRDLERRALTSEAALKRARLNYSIAVNQLQKDLDLLSFQVSSMFETNQNLINDAFSEPSQPLSKGYPIIVQTPQKSDAAIIMRDQNQTAGVENHLLGGDILSDDMKKSLCLQEDLYQKVEVELCEMRSSNLYLDIYSNTLKETLLEASKNIRVMKEKIDEYAKQLELSNESRSLLVAKLQTAVEDVHALNEDKADCIAQCSHLLRQNQMLEAKLESMSNEHFFLTEKLIDCEAQVMDYNGYEAKYKACFAEKSELENCLNLENIERENIQKEMSYLKEEFQTLKDKLGSLLTSYDSNFGEMSLFSSSLGHDLESKDIKGIIRDLEESQQNVCEKMVKIIEEKKCVENERDMAALSFSNARSEVLGMKQKFKNDVLDMVAKLDISNFLVEKLQLQLESVANKFHISSETEEKYLQLDEELLAYLASLELELQKLSSKTGVLDQEISGLGTMAEELGRCKLTISELLQDKQNLTQKVLGLGVMVEELEKTKFSISELKQENQELVMSVQVKTDESVKLVSELERVSDEHRRSNLIISELMLVQQDLEMSLQSKTEESIKLESELRNLDAELRGSKLTISELMRENEDLSQKISGLKITSEELEGSKLTVSELMQEKQDLVMSLHSETEQSIKLKSEVDRLAKELGGNKLIISELMQEKKDLAQEILGLKTVAEELGGNKSTISELMQEKEDYVRSLQSKTEESIKLESDLDSLAEELGRSKLTISELMQEKEKLSMSLESKTEESIKLESELHRLADELRRSKLTVSELVQEKQGLVMSLQSKIEDTTMLESELDRLKESLRCMNNEMHVERGFRDKLEGTVANLTSQLAKEQEKLVHFNRQNTDLVHFRQLALDLESANSRSLNLLQQHEENVEKLRKENRSFNALDYQLIEMEENIIGADVKLCFVQTQYETLLEDLVQQHVVEVEQLKHVLSDLNHEIDNLIFSVEESEVIRIVLKAKLDEQNSHLTLLEEQSDELIVLREKLSEQILKTEEFKNLSINLKELKDKADAESVLAREKRESEGSSLAVRESLRVAFIKEQYETKLQELRQQLSMSKRHGEDILLKLQDAIDETENRKKSEASHLKKNEELSLKVLELEAELQSVISDKREKINAYDRIKTELECALLSLECCKEEKEKLNASLQICEEEKSRMVVGFSLIKGEQSLSSGVNAKREENGVVGEERKFSDVPITRIVSQQHLMEGTVSLERRNMDDSASISTGDHFPMSGTSVTDSEGVQGTDSIPVGEVEHPADRPSVLSIQGVSNSEDVDGTPEHVLEDKGNSHLGNSKHLAVVNDHFRVQTLRSSMEHLDEELERMKNENSQRSLAKFDPTFQELHKDLLQLQKANQELASMCPLFNDLTGTGNALERVLALEIELAEALRAKKKSSIQFQSSFLKQHSDEEAVFKSFRDINELIRDMLELKGKYTNVETELKEMHDRYSQLSLQFAEVEGERQKLTMTLKNVRASKKQLQLNRSSSATLSQGDHPL